MNLALASMAVMLKIQGGDDIFWSDDDVLSGLGDAPHLVEGMKLFKMLTRADL